MRLLSAQEANEHLSSHGMELGDWNEIRDVGGRERDASQVRQLHAQDYDLLNLCHHLVAWLPRGDWKLFQADHSTGWLDPVQMSWISGLVYGGEGIRDLNDRQNLGFLFVCDSRDPLATANKDLVVANLMYVFLLFNLHAYVVSSDSRNGEMVGLHDGVVYLSSRSGAMVGADAMIDRLARQPSARPKWILDLIATHQEQTLVRRRSDTTQ